MRKMKNLMNPLVSISNLHPKRFKVVEAITFRLVSNKKIEISSNIKLSCLRMNRMFGAILGDLN